MIHLEDLEETCKLAMDMYECGEVAGFPTIYKSERAVYRDKHWTP